MLSRASRTNETLLHFGENMDPDKWDTTMWYQGRPKSTGIPRVDGLSTGPSDLGRHKNAGIVEVNIGLHYESNIVLKI